jgi:HTH-type transcriptional repressor of NAD biosynthesis genes
MEKKSQLQNLCEKMKNGLVFGKFMPLHKGHLSLINFALKNCDRLNVVLCHHNKEKIPAEIRLRSLQNELSIFENVNLISFQYNNEELPDTSVSSVSASNLWAMAFKKLLPETDVVFTSEKYGDYLAKAMKIEHICFDEHRIEMPVSGSLIRKNPFKYWDYICKEARPFFVKKISILGSESTGKSVLTKRLANYYKTLYVPEAAREILEKTALCRPEDLLQITATHAKNIIDQSLKANKLLFIDTDLNITKSYSSFLFHRELQVDSWQEKANKSDLYLFLETDCPYIQDGTRLDQQQRENLNLSHKRILETSHIQYIQIRGNWEERFEKAKKIIEANFFTDDKKDCDNRP